MLSDRASVYASYDLDTREALAHEQRLGEESIFSFDFAARQSKRVGRALTKQLVRRLT